MKYLVMYDHRHGVDTWLRDTKEEANISVGNTMLEWLHELDSDDAKTILQLLNEGDFSEARRVWLLCTNETFFVDALPDVTPRESKEDFCARLAEAIKKHEEEECKSA